jgi:predicted alpha/beta hydrolase
MNHRITITTGAPLTLVTDDHVAIAAVVHEPAGEARGNVLILGATATPRAYYDRFAAHLAAHGLRVLSFDYRGVGGSRLGSLRGDRSTMTDWAALDARAALAWLKSAHPGLPTMLVGHSFGAQALGICDELAAVDAVVSVGAQLGAWRHWPAAQGLALAAWWRAIPVVTGAVGWLPGWMGLTHDLPAGVANEWARWCDHPDYLIGHVEGAAARFARVRAPVLAYSFTDDGFAPRRAVAALLARFSGARVLHRRVAPEALRVPEIGHFGFFRPAIGAVLWGEVTGFFDDVLAGASPRVAEAVRAQGDAACELHESDVLADLQHGVG